MYPVAVLLSLFLPGAGHLYLGRHLRGVPVLLAALVLAYGAGFIHITQDPPAPEAVRAMLGCIVLLWVYALGDVLNRSWLASRGRGVDVDADLTAFLGLYAAGDDAAAAELLEGLAARRPNDPDICFYRAAIAAAVGDRRGAQVSLRRLRDLDLDGKWTWQVGRLERELKEAPAGAAEAS